MIESLRVWLLARVSRIQSVRAWVLSDYHLLVSCEGKYLVQQSLSQVDLCMNYEASDFLGYDFVAPVKVEIARVQR